MKLNKKSVAIATAALVIVGGGSAYAYFSITGSGAGTATVGSPEATTVELSADFTAPAIGDEATVKYNAKQGSSDVVLNKLLEAPTLTVTPADGLTCPAGSFTLGAPTWVPGFPVTVTAGTAKQEIGSATLTFNNFPTVNQDGCKNATVKIEYSVE